MSAPDKPREPAAETPPQRVPQDRPAEQRRPQDGRPAGVSEHGGPRGPEPTRYGDWEKGGRCTDF